jgi:hypothetical protein
MIAKRCGLFAPSPPQELLPRHIADLHKRESDNALCGSFQSSTPSMYRQQIDQNVKCVDDWGFMMLAFSSRGTMVRKRVNGCRTGTYDSMLTAPFVSNSSSGMLR